MTAVFAISAAPALANIRWEFHSAKEFDRYYDLWNELNQATGGLPVLTAEFIAPLLKEFGTGRELLAIGYGSYAAQVITVLYRKNIGFWETFQPAQAPLGAWVYRPPHTLASLVPGLLSSLPGFAAAVGVTQQDPDLVRRPEAGKANETLDYIETARVTISGPFDDYWAARGKNLRNNTKKQRNRLAKDGVALHLDVITDPADVAQAISDYGRLESAGWKAEAGTAIHPGNAQGRFYQAVLETFCRRGAGRIYRYRYGDMIVAIDLCVENRDTLIVLKTTYDESIRESSPASLLRQEYFRQIFDEGRIKRIEFYGKVMEWHTRWSDEIRMLYHANFYRSAALLKARRILRRRIKEESPGTTPESSATAPTAANRQLPAKVVTIYQDLSALPARYEPLFDLAGKTSLFHTLPWYRNFIQTVLTPGERLRVYAVGSAENPSIASGVLLMRHNDRGATAIGARTLNGLCTYYTSLFGPVIAPDESGTQEILDALAAAIATDEMGWNVIDLHPLANDSPVFTGLMQAFRKTGMLTRSYFCFGNWYLKVGGRSYAEYFESLPSQLKSTIARKRKQFEKHANSKIVIYRHMADFDAALHAYEQIYAASWKVPEPYPLFIRGLCRTSAESGWLRLGVAYIDDQPAAAQIWLVNGGIANIYKLAYDKRFTSFSLGTILTAHMMEHVIDIDKVHDVDYLTGDDAYKKDWMSDRRERWGIVSFNLGTPWGALAAMRHVGGSVAKRALNALRGFGGPRA
jgi:CelD/BcsL family acetyltransferase involved in cellulose biosynthesis